MRDIEDTVSNFIQTQFPEFYRDEGPIFILFLEEYYKWLETFYSYAELEDASGFEINNTVNQGAASGVIEAKADNFVLIRNWNKNEYYIEVDLAHINEYDEALFINLQVNFLID